MYPDCAETKNPFNLYRLVLNIQWGAAQPRSVFSKVRQPNTDIAVSVVGNAPAM